MTRRPRNLVWVSVALATGTVAVAALIVTLDRFEIPPNDVGPGESSDDVSRSAARPGRHLPPEADVLVGWSSVELAGVDADRVPPNRQEGGADAVLVGLAKGMWDWQAGDRVTLFIPHIAETFDSVIDRVVTELGDNRSYVGRLDGEDRPYPVVVTVGARNAYAYIATPKGSYELVGNREYGWLMPTARMDRHVDYSQPDFYLPAQPLGPGEDDLESR